MIDKITEKAHDFVLFSSKYLYHNNNANESSSNLNTKNLRQEIKRKNEESLILQADFES